MTFVRKTLSPGLLAGVAGLLVFGVFGSVIKFVNCNEDDGIENHHRTHQHDQTRTLTLCDASGESSEECSNQQQQQLQRPKKHPKFLLYKKSNITGQGEYIPLKNDIEWIRNEVRPFKGAVWKILIHGFLNNANSTFPVNVRDAYMERMRRTNDRVKYNILVVDWGELACASVSSVPSYLYNYTATNTANVGTALGKFIVFLHNHGFMNSTTDAHLIGFSLGAHIAGQAGRQVFDMIGKTVRRITGLDPASRAFWAWKFLPDFVIPKRRLHRKDTQFLDVYHTSSFFGSYEKMGDVDFWINGGGSQPSCVPRIFSWWLSDVTQVCSHNYVTILYANSINDNSMHACQCPSYRSYSRGSCKCFQKAVFGEFVDNSSITVGEFYINTPLDDAAMGTYLGSWHGFSIKNLIQQLRDMICHDWIDGET